jgi:hypothetical protein
MARLFPSFAFALTLVAHLQPALAKEQPGAPTLFVTASGNSVHAVWATGAGGTPTSYVVYVGTSPGASDFLAQDVGLVTSGTGVLPNGTYYVRVAAINAQGSATSDEVTLLVGVNVAAPGPPSRLSLSVTGSTVSLSWASPETGGPVSSYVIEAGSSPGASNLARMDSGTTATTFSAGGVSPGVYFVRVRARGAGGTSGPSNEAIAAVGAAPGLLRFHDGDPGVPGDGHFVSATGGMWPTEFELDPPFSLAGVTNGVYVWLFLPGNSTLLQNVGFQIEAARGGCSTAVGSSGAGPISTISVNGVTGVQAVALQSTLVEVLSHVNMTNPGCGFTMADLHVHGLTLFTGSDPFYALSLDAAAMQAAGQ